MARVFFSTLAILMAAFAFAPRALAAPTVKVDILVIEAKREKGGFDARIAKLKEKIERAGFKSAQVVDELSHREIELGARVSLQMPSKKQSLSVRVLEVKNQKIKLQVAIEGTKFETVTEHTNGGMLLVGIPQKDDQKAMMLGVTPTLVP